MTENYLESNIIKKTENKYFCYKCERFHNKKYRGNFSQIFKKHRKFETEISESDLWILKLKRSMSNYTIKSHKKSSGSKKQ